MEKVLRIIIAILLFSIIIIFHELGHYLLAKKNDVYVKEFALGLGPTLVSFNKKGETKVCLKLLPFGGACVMEGEDEESDSPRAFNKKKAWQRFLIIFCGPFFNFIMAFIFSIIIIGNMGIDKPILGDVVAGSGAEAAGLQVGDKIIKIDGHRMSVYREISMYIFYNGEKDVEVTYERNNERNTVTITPSFDEEAGRYLMGITGSGRTKLNFIETIGYSFNEVGYWIKTTLQSLSKLITGQVSFNNMSGPVGIIKTIGDTVEQSQIGTTSRGEALFYIIMNLLNMGVLLSANLGVMNLLPLPALDGGRLIFILIEWIRGKKIPSEKEGIVHFVGIILLVILMVVVMFNDIRKLIMGI